jgi:hypothetical protein
VGTLSDPPWRSGRGVARTAKQQSINPRGNRVTIDYDILLQTITSMLVITTPFDPVKILIFNRAISDPERSRTVSASFLVS